MRELLIRCSAVGNLMTEPLRPDDKLRTPEIEEIMAKKKRTDAEKEALQRAKDLSLSEGAKTQIRELAAQALLGVDFEFTSKYTDKGLAVENEGIELLNRVRGLSLVKNKERRKNAYLTGECDLYDAERNRGHDIKCAWSAATFPVFVADARSTLYEWQCRGYMWLWDADEWSVDYCLLDTPEEIMGRYEPIHLHIVSHIPEHHRLTTWTIKRDAEKEALMVEKVKAAREYMKQCIAEFDRRTSAQFLNQLQPA